MSPLRWAVSSLVVKRDYSKMSFLVTGTSLDLFFYIFLTSPSNGNLNFNLGFHSLENHLYSFWILSFF